MKGCREWTRQVPVVNPLVSDLRNHVASSDICKDSIQQKRMMGSALGGLSLRPSEDIYVDIYLLGHPGVSLSITWLKMLIWTLEA